MPEASDAEADSAGEPPGADSLRIARAGLKRGMRPYEPKGFERPRWVMMRSLLVPGWGQAYNGSWWKAGLIGGTELVLIGKIVKDRKDLNDIQAQIDAAHVGGSLELEQELVDRYNQRSDKFVGHQWWLGGLLAYAMLDAYIDAHFRHFRMELEDEPTPPDVDRDVRSLRLYWQEKF